MKKQLLFTALLASSFSQAQLTQSNEPVLYDAVIMYEADSTTDPLANTTGSGVTWDYSELVGVSSTASSNAEVMTPSGAGYASDFPNSDRALSVANATMTNFFNSSSTSRNSQGFVYVEPTFGTVKAVYDTDDQILMTYPFALNSSVTDIFSGTLYFSFSGLPMSPACSGVTNSTIDGEGTLLLPSGTSLSNVLRYKVIDTINSQVNIGTTMDIMVVRTEYDYYDVSSSHLPVFTYASIAIYMNSSMVALQKYVYSTVYPVNYLGVDNASAATFTMYPNPTEGKIAFNGDFSGDANAVIFDQTGRQVYEISSLENGKSVDISSLNSGIYTVKINNGGAVSTQTLSVK